MPGREVSFEFSTRTNAGGFIMIIRFLLFICDSLRSSYTQLKDETGGVGSDPR